MISVQELQKSLEIGKTSANTLVQDLERLGILKEVTGQQRDRIYSFDSYLRLFLDSK